jgi:uncharacterized protein
MRPKLEGRVRVEAEVSPSEDPEKVARAVSNVVGGAGGRLEFGERRVSFTSPDVESLNHFRDQLRDRHVRAAARRILLVRKEGSRTTAMLNRQAASAGVLAMCDSPEESSLGPIYLTIESRGLGGVIDWLTGYGSG